MAGRHRPASEDVLPRPDLRAEPGHSIVFRGLSTEPRSAGRRPAVPTANALRSAGPSEGREHATAYETLKAQFTEEEQVKLTVMINIISGWNRIDVGFGLYVDAATIKAARASAA